jgi:hypothetical protein
MPMPGQDTEHLRPDVLILTAAQAIAARDVLTVTGISPDGVENLNGLIEIYDLESPHAPSGPVVYQRGDRYREMKKAIIESAAKVQEDDTTPKALLLSASGLLEALQPQIREAS